MPMQQLARHAGDPQPGFFRVRHRVSRAVYGPWLPALIVHAPPDDPVTGEPLDRSWFWHAVVDGRPEPLANHSRQPTNRVWWIWTWGEPVEQAYYDQLLAYRGWLRKYDPRCREADPRAAVDLKREPIVF